jgi:hypothetical protein
LILAASILLAALLLFAAAWLILVAPLAASLAGSRMGLIVLLGLALTTMALLAALGLFVLLH